MSVWLTIPSARPVAEAQLCINSWRELGYNVALIRQGDPLEGCDIQISTHTYMGYPKSINLLSKLVLAHDDGAEWMVIGGDDYYPDPRLKACNIAHMCNVRFKDTYGVMQPTGDREHGGVIDTAAASAWIGRDWCRRAYGGRGPLPSCYYHYYTDTELQEVAILQDVFHQDQSIFQEHRHWTREFKPAPSFMAEAISMTKDDRDVFHSRRITGFPGHGPLPLQV